MLEWCLNYVQVPDTGGVYFIPAFGGLLAPHWEEDARGALLGMTAFTTRGHVVRALLEAICFQTREVLEAMMLDTSQETKARTLSRGLSSALNDDQQQQHEQKGPGSPVAAMLHKSASYADHKASIAAAARDADAAEAAANGSPEQKSDHSAFPAAAADGAVAAGVVDHVAEGLEVKVAPGFNMSLNLLRVDGGATHNDTLMQLQSDILQVLVQRPKFQETTALGAALAAGLTVGLWDENFVLKHPSAENYSTFRPSVSKEDAAKRFRHWQKAVSRCLDLADLAT
eukprot:GHUV01010957.1.p1 GENE.GHUV01010957.1~~GHUV01010957.1.p1  ORF type:complete len:285 (+),score=84.19 GHUV01010957.1:85-939(+)